MVRFWAAAMAGLALGCAPAAAQDGVAREMQAFWAFRDYCVVSDADGAAALAAADADGMREVPSSLLSDFPLIDAGARVSPSSLGHVLIVGAAQPTTENPDMSGDICIVMADDLSSSALADLINAWLGGHGGDFADNHDARGFAYQLIGETPRRISPDISDDEGFRIFREGRIRFLTIETDGEGVSITLSKFDAATAERLLPLEERRPD